MSKRPDNLETLHIALELLRRIPRGSKISAKELRQQLEQAGLVRDLRTIQRQLEFLSQHFGIESDDSGRPFGYRWSPVGRPLLQPNLTEQESLLLTLAEQHLRNLLPANLMKSMNGFFSQARSKIGPHTNAQLEREWISKVRVVSETQPLLPPKIRPGIFDEVSSALYANRWLQVDYQNASGKRSRNEVMPLGLAQQGPRLYLVCRYADHENERSLALHRILSANVMAHTFTRPKDFDLKKYDDDGRFGFGEGERISVTFRIDKIAGRHLLETPLSLDQQVIELKNTYQITATVVDSEVFWRWLRGFGKAAAIIE